MLAVLENSASVSNSIPIMGSMPAPPGPEASMRHLAAALAHNVNNALTGVIGHLELALRDLPPDSPVRPHLSGSLAGAYQIADVVRRIVGFAFRSEISPSCDLLALSRAAAVAARRVDPVARRQGVDVGVAG